MTWQSAQDATSTHSCRVDGCTGIARIAGALCPWHQKNGEPSQYKTEPRQTPEERLEALQDRVDTLDRQIARARDEQKRLMEERRRVYRRLMRAKEAA